MGGLRTTEKASHDIPASDNDRLDRIEQKLDKLATEFDRLATDNEKFNDRFDNYQKATQWVVQLAFTLIASATLTVIIASVVTK
jgi:predicted nuclease with TOPRIM domain